MISVEVVNGNGYKTDAKITILKDHNVVKILNASIDYGIGADGNYYPFVVIHEQSQE